MPSMTRPIPTRCLAGIYRMLRPGGTYLCVEPKSSSELADNIDEPMSAFMYSVSTMHCMTVSLAYGGEGLGTAWGHQTAVERLTLGWFRRHRCDWRARRPQQQLLPVHQAKIALGSVIGRGCRRLRRDDRAASAWSTTTPRPREGSHRRSPR